MISEDPDDPGVVIVSVRVRRWNKQTDAEILAEAAKALATEQARQRSSRPAGRRGESVGWR